MPPTPSSGSTASAMTMMERPPNHSSACRHRFTEGGRASRPTSTVEPVVVRPDMASKYAAVKLRWGSAKCCGRRQQQPAERHQQKAVARLQLAAEAPGRRGEDEAHRGGDRGRGEELREQT